jgi:hypothetical protein
VDLDGVARDEIGQVHPHLFAFQQFDLVHLSSKKLDGIEFSTIYEIMDNGQ